MSCCPEAWPKSPIFPRRSGHAGREIQARYRRDIGRYGRDIWKIQARYRRDLATQDAQLEEAAGSDGRTASAYMIMYRRVAPGGGASPPVEPLVRIRVRVRVRVRVSA